MIYTTQQSTQKRKSMRYLHRPLHTLSIPMMITILILKLLLHISPTSFILGFSIIGNEPMRSTRTFSTKTTPTTNSDSSTTSRRVAHPLSAVTNHNNNNILVQPSPSAIGVSTKDEQAVDEYLEFLDRRYRRLHDDRPSNEFASVPLSVWKWLHQEDAAPTTTHSANRNPAKVTTTTPPYTATSHTDDALYVLGVAGLASKRLLQKHHLSASLTTTEHDAVVTDRMKDSAIDVDYSDSTSVSRFAPSSSTTAVVTAETVAQFVVRLLVSRKALMEYQSKQLKVALLLLLRGPIQVTRSLWKFCGGTRTVKRTLSLTIVMSFLVFRTVSYIISNETA